MLPTALRSRLLAAGLLAGFALSALCEAQAPALEYSSLLRAPRFYSGGTLGFDRVFAVFLPPAAHYDAKNLVRESDQCHAVLRRTSGGPELDRWPLLAEPHSTVFSTLRPVGRPFQHEFSEEGAYVLTIQLDDQVLGELPFEVAFRDSGDPFNPARTMLVDGPWGELGWLSFGENSSPDGMVAFAFHARGGLFNESGETETLEVELRHEGNVAFAGGKHTIHADPNQSDWRRLSNAIQLTKGDGGGPIRVRDLVQKPGSYQVVVRRQGEVWGVYPFEVAGGKVTPIARQAIGHQPHTQYLCGRYPSDDRRPSRDLFWMERLTGEAAHAALAGSAPAVSGPSAEERARWVASSSADPQRAPALSVTSAIARMDAALAVGDDVIAFGTGAVSGVSYLVVGEDRERTLPRGQDWSSKILAVCGKKIVLTQRNQVAVFDTETERLVELPPDVIHLSKLSSDVYGASALAADGMLVATLNDPTKVKDRRMIKVLDLSGDEPRVLALRNPDVSAKELVSIGVEAASGKVAVGWHRGQGLWVGDVAPDATLRGFNLGAHDGFGRTSPIRVAGGRVLYFDAAGARRLRFVDIAEGRIDTIGTLGRAGRHFDLTAGRLAYMTDESRGSNYRFVTGDFQEGSVQVTEASNLGESSPGNGNFGMATSVALAEGGLCFLAGQGKGGVGSGEVLQAGQGERWVVLAGPDGAALPAVDVVGARRVIAFKTGKRNDTRVGYLTFGERLTLGALPAASE